MKKIIGIIIALFSFCLLCSCNNDESNETQNNSEIIIENVVTYYQGDDYIDITVSEDTTTFNITQITIADEYQVKGYSDSNLSNEVGVFELVFGENKYYIGIYENNELFQKYVLNIVRGQHKIVDLKPNFADGMFYVNSMFNSASTLDVIYTDGDIETVQLHSYMVEGYDTSEAKEITLTITYNDYSVEVIKEVVLKKIKEIVKVNFLNINYCLNEKFDGFTLDVVYEDDTTGSISYFDTTNIRGFDTSTYGKKSIEVMYGGNVIYKFDINVISSEITNIDYSNLKLEYDINEQIQPGSVDITFSDGRTETFNISVEDQDFDTTKPIKYRAYYSFNISPFTNISIRPTYIIGGDEIVDFSITYIVDSLPYDVDDLSSCINSTYIGRIDVYTVREGWVSYEDSEIIDDFLKNAEINLVSEDEYYATFNVKVNNVSTEVKVYKKLNPCDNLDLIEILPKYNVFVLDEAEITKESVLANLEFSIINNVDTTNRRVLTADEVKAVVENFVIEFEQKEESVKVSVKYQDNIIYDLTHSIVNSNEAFKITSMVFDLHYNIKYKKITQDYENYTYLIYDDGTITNYEEYIKKSIERLELSSLAENKYLYNDELSKFINEFISIDKISDNTYKANVSSYNLEGNYYFTFTKDDVVININMSNYISMFSVSEDNWIDDLLNYITSIKVEYLLLGEVEINDKEEMKAFLKNCKVSFDKESTEYWTYLIIKCQYYEHYFQVYSDANFEYNSAKNGLNDFSNYLVCDDVSTIDEVIKNNVYQDFIPAELRNLMASLFTVKSEVDGNKVTFTVYYKDKIVLENSANFCTSEEAKVPRDVQVYFTSNDSVSFIDYKVYIISSLGSIQDYLNSIYYVSIDYLTEYVILDDDEIKEFINKYVKLDSINENEYLLTIEFNNYEKSEKIVFETNQEIIKNISFDLKYQFISDIVSYNYEELIEYLSQEIEYIDIETNLNNYSYSTPTEIKTILSKINVSAEYINYNNIEIILKSRYKKTSTICGIKGEEIDLDKISFSFVYDGAIVSEDYTINETIIKEQLIVLYDHNQNYPFTEEELKSIYDNLKIEIKPLENENCYELSISLDNSSSFIIEVKVLKSEELATTIKSLSLSLQNVIYIKDCDKYAINSNLFENVEEYIYNQVIDKLIIKYYDGYLNIENGTKEFEEYFKKCVFIDKINENEYTITFKYNDYSTVSSILLISDEELKLNANFSFKPHNHVYSNWFYISLEDMNTIVENPIEFLLENINEINCDTFSGTIKLTTKEEIATFISSCEFEAEKREDGYQLSFKLNDYVINYIYLELM